MICIVSYTHIYIFLNLIFFFIIYLYRVNLINEEVIYYGIYNILLKRKLYF